MRYLARTVALLWAGWWVFFGLTSSLSEGLRPVDILIHAAIPGLVFVISAIIAWRWEAIGGVLLLQIGLLVLIAYIVMAYNRFPLSTITVVLLAMALPPLVAGALCCACGRRSKHEEQVENGT